MKRCLVVSTLKDAIYFMDGSRFRNSDLYLESVQANEADNDYDLTGGNYSWNGV